MMITAPLPRLPAPGAPAAVPLASVQRWIPLIREVIAAQGATVPASAVAGLVDIESDGNPDAQSRMNVYGGRYLGRAMGLGQVMPFHFGAPLLGNGEVTEEWRAYMCEPRRNLEYCVRILEQNYQATGDVRHAAAAYFGAYNWAERRITRATDVNGVNGEQYVQLFDAARALYPEADTSAPQSWVYWPLNGEITQRFNWPAASGQHTGIDIAAPLDTLVKAPADGVCVAWKVAPYNSGDPSNWKPQQWGDVIGSGWEFLTDRNGSFIVLDHGGEYSLHMHTATKIARGDRVVAGQDIGFIDNTGYTYGPHGHHELRFQGSEGVPRDPMLRLAGAAPAPSPQPPTPEPPKPEPPKPTPDPQSPEWVLRTAVGHHMTIALMSAATGAESVLGEPDPALAFDDARVRSAEAIQTLQQVIDTIDQVGAAINDA